MPIHGYRELLNHTVWDAMSLSSLAERPSVRLFGDVSDRLAKTNAWLPNQFPSDSTMLIRHWYARTNLPDIDIPDTPAWRSRWLTFLNTTIVRLIVGERLMSELPLAMLMGAHRPLEGRYPQGVVARDMYRLFSDAMKSPPRTTAEPMRDWAELTDDERLPWITAARLAEYFSIPVIVPVRCSYRIEVEAVSQMVKDLRASLTPEQASATLIWVHLEGILQRSLI